MIGKEKSEGDSRIQMLNEVDSSHAKKGSNIAGIPADYTPLIDRLIMFDPFFRWVESTELSVWINQSPSLFAFPGILAAHTVGLGLLAGLNSALDLRLLGIARSIPPAAFMRLLPVMWLGLWMNVLSGIALLVAYPTKALTNPLFYLKLALIAVALVLLRSLVRRIRPAEAIPGTAKILAVASLLVWAATIAAGRFLAYTCTRLTVDLSC
jgi:uncharacterized protein DUF6644